MDRDGHSFERGGFGKTESVWKFVGNALRNDDVFGESSRAAVISAGNAKHLAAVAKIDFAAGTIRAGTARNRRIERDAIAFGPTRDLRAKGGDAASRFVAHHDGRDTTAGGSVVAVDVAAADAAGRHVNQEFAATGNRCGKLGNFQTPVLGKKHCFHRDVRSVRPFLRIRSNRRTLPFMPERSRNVKFTPG